MKKLLSVFISICLFSLFNVTALAASTVSIKSIKLSASAITLNVGKSSTLKATVSPSSYTSKVNWSTSNGKIATVNKSGKVTAIKAGTCNITAAVGSKTAKCSVKVQETGKSSLTIKSINTVMITTTMGTAPNMPKTVTAVMNDGTTKSVAATWNSINPSAYATTNVITVKGKVDGYSSGVYAVITVTAPSNSSAYIEALISDNTATIVGTAPALSSQLTAYVGVKML